MSCRWPSVSVIRPGVPGAQSIAVAAKPFGIAAGADGIWVASDDRSTVTRIDPELRRVVKVVSVALPGDVNGIYGVAVGAGGVWAEQ
jgi:hypothetical protein